MGPVLSSYSLFQRKLQKAFAGLIFGLALTLTISLPARAQEDRAVLTKVKAVYPEMAKRLKITGTVMMNATVTPAGTVKEVKTVMGEKMLLEAAKEAVLKWKFAPADHQTIEDVEVEFP
jgi:TonB family protein